jgi:RNA polymerase sigma-32 factor
MVRKNSKRGAGKKKTDPAEAQIENGALKSASARRAKKSTGLVPTDPLSRYLEAVREIPRLSPEEEQELIKRVRKGDDQDAALRLVTANLWLVVNISFEFHSQFQNMLDLIQEGNIGLMRAIQKFDPFKGVRLPAYASYWIRAYILKYILNNWRLVRVGTTNMRRKLLFNLNKVTREMVAAGIEPSPRLLAEHFSTTQENVIAVQQSLSSRDLSLETPVSEDSTMTLGDTIGSDASPIEDALGESEIMARFKKEVDEFSKPLKESDRMILYKRLMSDDPMTLAKIGERFGVSREAMRQAEERLIIKLKKHLEEKLPEIKGLNFVPKTES